MVIYRITHRATGRHYVGRTINPEGRWQQHLYGMNRHINPLYNAMRKHGSGAFEFVVLETFPGDHDGQKRELHWIAELKVHGPHGFNRAPRPMDPESKRQRAKARVKAAIEELGALPPDDIERVADHLMQRGILRTLALIYT